jgi:hypothetical protein
MPRFPSASNYVVTLGRIERVGVVNANALEKPCASNFIVTIGRIQRAGVVNAVLFPRAREEIVLAPLASECVVAIKSISDTSIDYGILARHRDNISFVGKRYS